MQAPEFPFPPTDAVWLNSPPLHFHDQLKGRIVLLQFWTYTCMHCLHALADLQLLAEKYAGRPLTIIGIHAGKYPATDSFAAVKAAIERLAIHHPVFIDRDRALWKAYGVPSWPTHILIGPDSQIIGTISGEGHRKLLESSINRALADIPSSQEKPTVCDGATPYAPTPQPPSLAPNPILSFPTKILPDPANNRLIILDTGHHRILITTLPDGHNRITLQHIIGTGHPGASDGDFQSSSFHRPQGAALAGNILYVADTANHLIRRVDLARQRVTTVLGTGENKFDHEAGKTGREQPLNSPWDLALHANRLYVSQAGQHQIFAMNLMSHMTEVAAGTAREGLRDGDAASANLDQPSALALDPNKQILYFTDAQSSALRALDLRAKQVTTLVGTGPFDFGDQDGPLDTGQLQHPLGLALAADGQRLLLADTLNHKIKIIDPTARTIQTLPIHNLHLYEPSGVAASPISSHDILVADTNQHRIICLKGDGGAWQELTFKSRP